MKILKFKKVSKDKYKVYLDNNEVVSLFEDVIVKNNLLFTKEINDSKLETLIDQNNEVYVYQQALGFISVRMRSKKEMYDYLSKKNVSSNLIDITINKLIKEGYLNDFNFSRAYVNDQMLLSNWGPYKIRNNLIKHGVAEEIINDVMEEIDNKKVREKLSGLIEKQVKIKKGSLNSVKIKLVNYFINLGYEKDMILSELSCYEIKSDPLKLKRDYIKLYDKYKSKYEGSKLMYFIAQKLYSKGYTSEDITDVIKNNNN